MTPYTLTIPPELVAELVERIKGEVLLELGQREEQSPYLTIEEAAEYARCSRQRLYDLRSSGRLSRAGDGRRALVFRQELDALLREGSDRGSDPPHCDLRLGDRSEGTWISRVASVLPPERRSLWPCGVAG